MKKRFSKILGVGLTLALLTSLLMTAAPVSALSVPTVVPASATISATTSYAVTFSPGVELGTAYTFQVQHKTDPAVGTATWVLDAGEYVAHLSTGTPDALEQVDYAAVVVPYDAALSTITELGYSYKIVDGRPANDSAPYLVLALDTTANDTADVWLVHNMFVGSALNTWDTWKLSVEGKTMTAGKANLMWHDQTTDYADWTAVKAVYDDATVLEVKVAVGEWDSDHLESNYVDNIKINTATYDLEPETITITFPAGTIVPVTATIAAGATIQASPGWLRGIWGNATTTGVTFASVPTTRTVTATLDPLTDEIGEGATVRIKVPGIKNPPTIGSYTLTVKTSKETTAVASVAYSVTAPTILPLPGVVERYNSADVLMEQTNKIQTAIDHAGAGDSINVGAGTYDEDIDVDESVTITGNAATTIIKDTNASGAGGTVTISFVGTTTVAGAVFDGFTVMGRPGVDALTITGHKVTVQNCIFTKAGTATTAVDQNMVHYNPLTTTTLKSTITNCTFDTTLGIVQDVGVKVAGTSYAIGLTVSNNTFTVDGAIGLEDSAVNTSGQGTPLLPITISGNTISGASGIGVTFTAGTATASDNTLTGLNAAFEVLAGTATIKGNTIDNCGLAINTTTALLGQAAIIVDAPTALSITNNTITNCPNDIIEIAAGANLSAINMMFNNLTDNAMGIDNNNTTAISIFNATHNWWGEATGPATGFNVTAGAVNNTAAYLGSEATGSFVLDTASLITKKTVGVDVKATSGADTPVAPAIIGVANYAANPQDATPLPALAGGFYDVYLADALDSDTTSVLIKFYNANVTANTKIYAWGTIAGGWVAVDTPAGGQGVNLYTGYAFATIGTTTTPSIADLAGTPFALVEATPAALGTPVLTAPTSGAEDVSLKPTFAWGTVPGAIGYDFELATNPNFVLPMVSLTGDVGRLIVTFYQRVTPLEYSTYYYWRVKAASATAESAWSAGVFYTVAEVIPEPEPEAPVWTCPQCGLTFSTRDALAAHAATAHPPVEPADIVIEQPDIIVPLPDVAAPITPAWIYAIIGVGAVLVIAVITLIVRTRRVA